MKRSERFAQQREIMEWARNCPVPGNFSVANFLTVRAWNGEVITLDKVPVKTTGVSITLSVPRKKNEGLWVGLNLAEEENTRLFSIGYGYKNLNYATTIVSGWDELLKTLKDYLKGKKIHE